jgi:hypothetical protein
VQIGASIMFALGRLAPHRQRGFMLAASAAGVAAAFNTPLAGIVFGIEEMSRSFEERTSTIIIGTVIAAGLTSLALVGNYDYFGSTPATLPFGPGWIATLLCGMLGGLLGGLFSRALIVVAHGLPGAAGRLLAGYPVAFAALCGLGVAICGLASGNSIFGTGYEQAQSIIHGGGTISWLFMPLKFIASVLSAERHPRRYFLAVSFDRCGARRRCRAPVFQRTGERAGAGRHGGVSDRRRAGADHRLRHRLGDDAKPRDDHPADAVRLDRRRRVEADHAARGVPRACRGDHPQARRGHAADPVGDGRRAGPETVALSRLWVQDNPNEGRRQTFPHDLA